MSVTNTHWKKMTLKIIRTRQKITSFWYFQLFCSKSYFHCFYWYLRELKVIVKKCELNCYPWRLECFVPESQWFLRGTRQLRRALLKTLSPRCEQMPQISKSTQVEDAEGVKQTSTIFSNSHPNKSRGSDFSVRYHSWQRSHWLFTLGQKKKTG